jgi:hypothetical protein
MPTKRCHATPFVADGKVAGCQVEAKAACMHVPGGEMPPTPTTMNPPGRHTSGRHRLDVRNEALCDGKH